MSLQKRRKVSQALRQELAATGVCAYCTKPLPANFHVDHVIPLSKGGTNDRANLVAACPSCNLRKSDKDWKPVHYHASQDVTAKLAELYANLNWLAKSLVDQMERTNDYLNEDLQKTEKTNAALKEAIAMMTVFNALLNNCRRCRRRKAKWFA